MRNSVNTKKSGQKVRMIDIGLTKGLMKMGKWNISGNKQNTVRASMKTIFK